MNNKLHYFDAVLNEEFSIDRGPLADAINADIEAGKIDDGIHLYTVGFNSRVPATGNIDGKPIVLLTSTAGANKKMKAQYTTKAFADLHPELFQRYYRWVARNEATDSEIAIALAKYNDAKAEADRLCWLAEGLIRDNMSERERTKHAHAFREAKKVEETAKLELEEIAVKQLINPSFTAARSKQATALRLRPGDLVDLGADENNSIVVMDVKIEFDTPDGRALDVESFNDIICKKYNCTASDGMAILMYENVKNVDKLFDEKKFVQTEDGLIEMMPAPYQIFSGGLTGCIKGCALVTKQTFKSVKAIDAFTGEEVDATGKNIFFASVVKDYKSYSSQKEFFAKNSWRIMEHHYEMKEISMSRQMLEMLYGATEDQIMKLAEKLYDQIMAASTKEGYAEECRKMIKELDLEVYAPMANSRIFINAIAKKIWNLYTHGCAGRIKTKGMTLFLTTSVAGIINHLNGEDDWVIGEDEVLLPYDAMEDYKVGDTIFLVRYPEMQPKPCLLRVAGFHEISGTAIIHPKKMIEKDADWDGDHGNFYGDPLIVEMAKNTLDLFKKCNGVTYVFEDVAAEEYVKTLDLEENIVKTATLGNVGSASSNMFVLAALIPVGATPDTEITISGYIPSKDEEGNPIKTEIEYTLTVKDIVNAMCIMKVAVTLEADSAKRGGASKFAESAIGKMLTAIRSKYIVYSEYFDHPFNIEIGKDYDGRGTYSKINQPDVDPKLILGRKICNSILVALHDKVHDLLGKKVGVYLRHYTDVLDSYKYTEFDTDLGIMIQKKSNGWTYVPNFASYNGIDPKGWMDFELYEEIAKITNGKITTPGKCGFKIDSYDKTKKYYGGIDRNGNELVGTIDELVKEFLGELTLQRDDMTIDEKRKHFSFESRDKSGVVKFGVLANRGHMAAKHASADDENGGRKQSHQKRDEYYKTTAILVCAYFDKQYGVKLPWDTAVRFVANEIRAYLFGKNASESSAPAVADMFTYYKDELKEIRKKNGLNY